MKCNETSKKNWENWTGKMPKNSGKCQKHRDFTTISMSIFPDSPIDFSKLEENRKIKILLGFSSVVNKNFELKRTLFQFLLELLRLGLIFFFSDLCYLKNSTDK